MIDEHKSITEKIREYEYDVYITLSKLTIKKNEKNILVHTLSSYDELIKFLYDFYNKILRKEKFKRLLKNEKNK